MTETQPNTGPSGRAPTLAEVARQAGVSKATASRALSTSPTRVDPETARRVKHAAEELRYTPNPHAQALARASSPSVGLLIHEVSNPFFSEIASGVLATAEHHDRMVMICNTRRDPAQEIRYVAEMRTLRLHAILLAGSEFVDETSQEQLEKELAEYQRTGGRVVLLRSQGGGAVVVPDTARGAQLLADHLLSLGHEHIGIVNGPPQLANIQLRLDEFERRLQEADLKPVTVLQGHFTREGGRRAAQEMLEAHPEVTAVFALNDLMAVGAIHAIQEMGRRVPEDVSVVGFNDLPIASDVSPALTTLRLPLRELGARALQIALGDDPPPERPVVLGVELVERASSGPVRS